MTKGDQLKEVNEAIEAGRLALKEMNIVSNLLDDSRGLGVWDMFGGGLFVSAMKHSKIDDAREELLKSVSYLRRFNSEINDVNVQIDCNLDMSNTLKGFDLFFDDIISDLLVQKKIKKMQIKVDETIDKLTSAMEKLHIIQRQLEKEGQV